MTLIEYLQTENRYQEFAYPEYLKRIVKIFKDRNIEITPSEANELWDKYSDDLCASWLILPLDDNEIFEIVINYAKKKYKMEDY